MIPATLAASCAFMMPGASPSNAIAFATGALTVPQMVRSGLRLNLICALGIGLAAFYVIPAIMNFDPTVLPDWERSARGGLLLDAAAHGDDVEGFEEGDEIRVGARVVAEAAVAEFVEGGGGRPVFEHHAIRGDEDAGAIAAMPAVHEHGFRGGAKLAEGGDELVDRDFTSVHGLGEEGETGFRELRGVGVILAEIEERADAEGAEIGEIGVGGRLLATEKIGADAVAVFERTLDERRGPRGGADAGARG
eukprot:gene57705-79063_t